jgi:hypothetical protein
MEIQWLVPAIMVVMFVGSITVLPILIVRIPADYFVREPVRGWPTRHPALHIALVIGKNLLGIILFLAGVAMLILPGQGLLTMLVGLMCIDFPGKRYWERKLIQQKPILNSANWIRRKYGRPPLVFERQE